MRKYSFKLDIEVGGNNAPNLEKVEELLNLHFQDLCYDEKFIENLAAEDSVSIQVVRVS